jgi:phenylacetate-CoA ligase
LLAQYQRGLIDPLIRHAAAHVPFYRSWMADHRIDPAKVDDLGVLERFPIVTKSEIKADVAEFTPENLAGLPRVHVQRTGGTTGEPLRFYTDAGRRSSTWACVYRFYDWMGIDLARDRKLVIWGAPIVAPGLRRRLRDRLLGRLENTRSLDSFRIRDGQLRRLQGLFERWRPRMIRGYCQSVYELARMFQRAGYQYPLKAVNTTVEPLFDEYRAAFREVFLCQAFDQYGCGEVEGIAFECERHQGMHVARERCLLELDGEGRVVVTDLDNLAFPFIRYRTDDVAELEPAPECACGRPGSRLRKIRGRSGDVIRTAGGGLLHPEFFTHLLNETGIAFRRDVRRYQVVQESRDSLRWTIQCATLGASDVELLGRYLRQYAGDMRTEIIRSDEIPLAPSGKHRYVISRVEGQAGPGES